MGKGQELYKKAKKLIPGGTMLLSKRPEMFLPELWPSYFSKAKGCKVWDLDGKEYTDVYRSTYHFEHLNHAKSFFKYLDSEHPRCTKEFLDSWEVKPKELS